MAPEGAVGKRGSEETAKYAVMVGRVIMEGIKEVVVDEGEVLCETADVVALLLAGVVLTIVLVALPLLLLALALTVVLLLVIGRVDVDLAVFRLAVVFIVLITTLEATTTCGVHVRAPPFVGAHNERTPYE